ncbi:MAG: ubiquinol-cytochrome c reductase iron-sulfur subunit [Pseudomonadota bacterium]
MAEATAEQTEIAAINSGAPINSSRRYFLIASTAAVAGAGVVGAAVPFVASWFPSAKAKAAGAPIRINIAKLQPGEMYGPIPAWRGQPVFVLNRTPEMLEGLGEHTGDLSDPESDVESQTPEYAKNEHRSIRPEIGVYLGLCTHLGCSPKFQPTVTPALLGDWKGGFFCPCHGSKFDLAGRVAKGVPAPSNLLVPPYYFEGANTIVIGEEGNA